MKKRAAHNGVFESGSSRSLMIASILFACILFMNLIKTDRPTGIKQDKVPSKNIKETATGAATNVMMLASVFVDAIVPKGSQAELNDTKLGVSTNDDPTSTKAFEKIRQIKVGVLNVGFVDMGPTDGPVVILLHGWPYDIHSFEEVAPILTSAGYRVIIPYLRGYGTTKFLSNKTMLNGQQSALAFDVINLMDALSIEKAIIAGFDWGARTANIVAALWPERCNAMVSASGYLIGNPKLNKIPLTPAAEFQWWYQYYFATERGRAGYEKYRNEFAKLIWRIASPRWNFNDATFEKSASSFNNPDHVSIVIHNYRWRLGLAEGEAKFSEFEKKLAEGPVITVHQLLLKATPTVRLTQTVGLMPKNFQEDMPTSLSMGV